MTDSPEIKRDRAAAPLELGDATYVELREIAGRLLRGHNGAPVRATSILHEAYCKLAGAEALDETSRTHFFALAARAMRQALVDGFRTERAAKRGGGWRRVPLTDAVALTSGGEVDAGALIVALDALAAHDPRAARVVELKFFAELSGREIAQLLGVSRSTVAEDWSHACAWLRRELARSVP